ncbi:MAG TPA: hypothetical protein VII17_00285 [Steroidobacteraceae bacterium]
MKWLGGCLPAGFGLSAAPITDRPAGDFAAEELLIARAAGRRRNEFRTGRALARQALAQIGCAAAAILARAQRDPVWPAGFLGSITHSERLVFAVAAPSNLIEGVGIDVEDDPELDKRLTSIVCRSDERQQQPERNAQRATGIFRVARNRAISMRPGITDGGVCDQAPCLTSAMLASVA